MAPQFSELLPNTSNIVDGKDLSVWSSKNLWNRLGISRQLNDDLLAFDEKSKSSIDALPGQEVIKSIFAIQFCQLTFWEYFGTATTLTMSIAEKLGVERTCWRNQRPKDMVKTIPCNCCLFLPWINPTALQRWRSVQRKSKVFERLTQPDQEDLKKYSFWPSHKSGKVNGKYISYRSEPNVNQEYDWNFCFRCTFFYFVDVTASVMFLSFSAQVNV